MKRSLRWIALAAMVGLVVVGLWASPQSMTAIGREEARDNVPVVLVEPALLQRMESEGQGGYIIQFRGVPDLSPAYSMDWDSRGWFVMTELMTAAETAQRPVRAYLDKVGVKYQSFWIANVILVDNSALAVFQGLRNFPQVQALTSRVNVQLEPPPREVQERGSRTEAVETNLSYINADEVWAQGYHGTGIVVANVDTGVRYTHEALVGHYRGNLGGGNFDHNYNWWDPSNICANPSTAPCDNNGHGSHTMGTMVGDDATNTNQIGVAPGAQWMACKGCENTSCSDAALLGCAQWIAAPWNLAGQNPDATKRPNIVNNSWGGGSGDNWYQASVDAWRASGIYVVFSNGNTGPNCSTVGSPGDYGNVTGVGAWDHNSNVIASFSSKGPSSFADSENPNGYPNLKPQVAAPGVNIRSSINTSDTAYSGAYSGTSMAAPHVAGTVALMWEAAPCLKGDFVHTETILEQTAMAKPSDRTCGTDASTSSHPNNGTGWGVIDAYAAVQAAIAYCGGQSCTNAVSDPGFENGPPPGSAWTEYTNTGCEWIMDPTCCGWPAAHGGTYAWWAGGYCGGNPNTNYVEQAVTVPASGTALTFWTVFYRADPDDPPNTDSFSVTVNGTPVFQRDMVQANNTFPNWVQQGPIDLSAYAGQSVTLRFAASLAGSTTGNVLVDDIELCGSAPVPTYDWHFADDYARSELCVNSQSGTWLYKVLKGNGAGNTYSGTGTITTGSGYARLTAAPGSGVGLNLTYYTTAHRATATFTRRSDAVSSALYDKDTTNSGACGLTPPP